MPPKPVDDTNYQACTADNKVGTEYVNTGQPRYIAVPGSHKIGPPNLRSRFCHVEFNKKNHLVS